MKSFIVTLILTTVYTLVFPFASHAAPQQQITARQGVLDARSLDLSQTVLSLKGEWEFYWQRLETPEHSHGNNSAMIEVPAVWADASYTGSQTLKNEGYGTYRLRIILSKQNKSKPLSLYIPSIASAYKLWVNGKLAASNGVVGTNKESMEAQSYSKVVTFQTNTNEIELILQVSNFTQRKGGMWKSIQLGSDALIRQAREYSVLKDSFLASSLFVLGSFQLILYLFHRKNLLSLFLGCFCLLMTLRTLLVGDRLLIDWIPSISWEFSVKLEYLTSYIGCLLLFTFVTYLYPEESNRFIAKVFAAICIGFSLTTLLTAIYFTKWIFLFQIFLVPILLYIIYIIIRAAIRKRIGALINCVMLIIIIICILHDIFYYHFFSIGTDAVPLGAFITLFVQSLIIAQRSSYALIKVERLSAELLQVNYSLEERITQRTMELKNMNEELQRTNEALQTIEKTRQQFFSTIAHEFGTPMQSIQGYLQLLQEGLPLKEQQKYLQVVYEKTKLLNRLSIDLLELAKMEENQIQFYFEEVEIKELLSYFSQRFKLEIERNGLCCEQTALISVPAGGKLFLRIDFIRLEQVFSNLLQNAIRHTPKGGKISLHSEAYCYTSLHNEEHWGIRILFCDTGSGIESELLPHLFKRFVKGKQSSSKTGTGLGLAICQQIIKHHGGTISVSSELGKGSQFTITLPAFLQKGAEEQ
ncbi:sensor histidine kinase [Ectobacillus funiculus]|uniref:histidine kinase n=1 Tax=Ectobacillus funiculus TaxID=137993 RepID=A0ABV5W918_9BACI